jgi:hypothetical protein
VPMDEKREILLGKIMRTKDKWLSTTDWIYNSSRIERPRAHATLRMIYEVGLLQFGNKLL